MHDTEPVRHGSPLRAGAFLLVSTVAALSGLLFTTQTGAVAAFDLGGGTKLPSSMQGDFTNGGSRLEAGDGTQAWLGTKQQALVKLKLKAGVSANDDQAPVVPSGAWARRFQSAGYDTMLTLTATTVSLTVYRASGASTSVRAQVNAQCSHPTSTVTAPVNPTGALIALSSRTSGTATSEGSFVNCTNTAGGLDNLTGWTVRFSSPTADPPAVIAAGGTMNTGGGADPSREGTPYARCANLSGDEISVYGTPITYKESQATGIVGTPAPSFTLPTCPASHPVRMGWGFQGPSGPLATVRAPAIPASLTACAGYTCDVVSAPSSAAQECTQLNEDGTVTTTPGGPCPPGQNGYCMWGPYSLAAAECAGAPQADPVEVEQDPGCTPDGLANLNPFAWMGGIPCLFKYLFIPDGDAWGDAGASIVSAWDGTAPAIVLAEGNKVFAPVVGLKDVAVGNCQGPPFAFPSLAGVTEPFTIHPLSTCNELATYLLGIYMPLATAMTYLGGFFSGTRLLLKSAGAESPVKDA